VRMYRRRNMVRHQKTYTKGENNRIHSYCYLSDVMNASRYLYSYPIASIGLSLAAFLAG
jgi:hypothetical protein